jgi:hypothetical protein
MQFNNNHFQPQTGMDRLLPIDDQSPIASWYNGGGNPIIMVTNQEMEKLQSEVQQLREQYLGISKRFQEYEVEHSEDMKRVEILDKTFKTQVKIEMEALLQQKQELRVLIAKKELDHLHRIQELESQLQEMKNDYEHQIDQLRKRFLAGTQQPELKSAVDQQRVENFLLRTKKAFPYSIASTTNWFQKWERENQLVQDSNSIESSTQQSSRQSATSTTNDAINALSSISGVTHGISSLLNHMRFNPHKFDQ